MMEGQGVVRGIVVHERRKNVGLFLRLLKLVALAELNVEKMDNFPVLDNLRTICLYYILYHKPICIGKCGNYELLYCTYHVV